MRQIEDFFGREKELAMLEDWYSEDKQVGCKVTGPRRIGKSYLLRRFCENKRHIFIQFIRGDESAQIERVIDALKMAGMDAPPCTTLKKALDAVGAEARKEKTVIVLDELPFLLKSTPDAADEIQYFVDYTLFGTSAMTIACGSILSIMTEETEDESKPLYGRFGREIVLKPLSPKEFRNFFPGSDEIDAMSAYLIFGGVPGKAEPFQGMSFDEMLCAVLAGHESIFGLIEGSLVSEVGDPRDYIAILGCIATGSTNLSEISQKTHLSEPLCLKRIRKLTKLGLIDTKKPMFGAPKRPSYYIKDNLTQFYFEVIRYCTDLLENPDTDAVARILKGRIKGFMGKRFELVCAEFLRKSYYCNTVGSWWGRSSKDDEPADIDIIANVNMPAGGMRVLFCECKYTDKPATWQAVNTLWERIDGLTTYGATFTLVVFSGYGFKDNLLEDAEDHGILLIGLEELLGDGPAPAIPRDCSWR